MKCTLPCWANRSCQPSPPWQQTQRWDRAWRGPFKERKLLNEEQRLIAHLSPRWINSSSPMALRSVSALRRSCLGVGPQTSPQGPAQPPCWSPASSPVPPTDSLPAEPQGKPKNTGVGSLSLLQWMQRVSITEVTWQAPSNGYKRHRRTQHLWLVQGHLWVSCFPHFKHFS